MSSQNVVLPPVSGGGGGAVDSVNGQTGTVVILKSDIGLGNVDNTSDANKPVSTAQALAIGAKQDSIIASNNQRLWQNGSGVIEGLPGFFIDTFSLGENTQLSKDVNNETGYHNVHYSGFNLNPIANSPDDTYNLIGQQVAVDTNDDGFSIGTNGQSVKFISNNLVNVNKSSMGAFEFINNNFNIGNGTDPVDVGGLAYAFGFGTFNANVNISGPLQGYGFQFNINAAATVDSTEYAQGFYDATNIGCTFPNYTSFTSSPTIAAISNNHNFSGYACNPTIPSFQGNAGFIGLSVSPTLGTFNANGYFHGVNVNPIITNARYAAGLQVGMDNVTPYAGVQSAITVQDLTYEFNLAGDNNSYTIEYTPGATAGAEVVTILGNAITIQIESGVSTATQVKAAADASPMITVITTTISGTASNPQVTAAAANFAGGENPGQVLAAYLDGDVQITGGLTFGGALSIGQLNAFASAPLVNGGGTPSSIHTLITNPTVAANATIANADTISVNTAALINIGDNATVTTSFVGVTALGLPAVLTMGSGSTLDQCNAALFALSLDAGATGGTVASMGLCRAVAIPNGTTTVTRLFGFKMDLPFGDPGTTSWGFYETPGINNYFAGNLLIGGTAGSDDTVTNSSVALEIKSTTKAFVASRMDTTARNALTAINGMVVYNTTTDKLQVYAAGSWVDLH